MKRLKVRNGIALALASPFLLLGLFLLGVASVVQKLTENLIISIIGEN